LFRAGAIKVAKAAENTAITRLWFQDIAAGTAAV
jgi:hypothetical protein